MSSGFLDLLKHLFPIHINIGYNAEDFKYSYTLDKKDFTDCIDKEFKYDRRLWNPFGKTGLAHHGPNGWDSFLPEEME